MSKNLDELLKDLNTDKALELAEKEFDANQEHFSKQFQDEMKSDHIGQFKYASEAFSELRSEVKKISFKSFNDLLIARRLSDNGDYPTKLTNVSNNIVENMALDKEDNKQFVTQFVLLNFEYHYKSLDSYTKLPDNLKKLIQDVVKDKYLPTFLHGKDYNLANYKCALITILNLYKNTKDFDVKDVANFAVEFLCKNIKHWTNPLEFFTKAINFVGDKKTALIEEIGKNPSFQALFTNPEYAAQLFKSFEESTNNKFYSYTNKKVEPQPELLHIFFAYADHSQIKDFLKTLLQDTKVDTESARDFVFNLHDYQAFQKIPTIYQYHDFWKTLDSFKFNDTRIQENKPTEDNKDLYVPYLSSNVQKVIEVLEGGDIYKIGSTLNEIYKATPENKRKEFVDEIKFCFELEDPTVDFLVFAKLFFTSPSEKAEEKEIAKTFFENFKAQISKDAEQVPEYDTLDVNASLDEFRAWIYFNLKVNSEAFVASIGDIDNPKLFTYIISHQQKNDKEALFEKAATDSKKTITATHIFEALKGHIEQAHNDKAQNICTFVTKYRPDNIEELTRLTKKSNLSLANKLNLYASLGNKIDATLVDAEFKKQILVEPFELIMQYSKLHKKNPNDSILIKMLPHYNDDDLKQLLKTALNKDEGQYKSFRTILSPYKSEKLFKEIEKIDYKEINLYLGKVDSLKSTQTKTQRWKKTISLLVKYVDHPKAFAKMYENSDAMGKACKTLEQLVYLPKSTNNNNKEHFIDLHKAIMKEVKDLQKSTNPVIEELKNSKEYKELLKLEKVNKRVVGLYVFAVAAAALAFTCIALKINPNHKFSKPLLDFFSEIKLAQKMPVIKKLFGNLDKAAIGFAAVAAAAGRGYQNARSEEISRAELRVIDKAIDQALNMGPSKY